MSDKFTVEQVEQFESDLREVIWDGKGSIHNNEFRAKFQDRIADMLRAYAARLREDDENAKDAARYRWLRDSDGAGGRIYCAMDQFEADGQCLATLLSGSVLDDAIDAAMREQGEG